MRIRLANASDQSAWDSYVLAHPEALAYHRQAWLRAVTEAYGFAACSLVVEADGRMAGVLPLIEFKVPLRGCTLVSLPYCDAGGPLADAPEITDALLAAARSLMTERGAHALEIRSAFPWPGQPAAAAPGKVRMLLSLPGSGEALLAGLKAKLRSQVNKPLRDGLTVRLGGPELVPAFYGVFAENMRDLGSPVHSLAWVEAIVRHYGAAARVTVVFTPSGEPAAGGILLQHGTKGVVPLASSLRRFNQLNPNMLLYRTLLTTAADQGCRVFDFGRSTPGEGTWRFKEQWGAQPDPLHWRRWSQCGETLAANCGGRGWARQQAERLWQHIPLEVSNRLGPRLRRYVSL
jgi:FemAB-related protein (PEP-CTERM system-associated)